MLSVFVLERVILVGCGCRKRWLCMCKCRSESVVWKMCDDPGIGRIRARETEKSGAREIQSHGGI